MKVVTVYVQLTATFRNETYTIKKGIIMLTKSEKLIIAVFAVATLYVVGNSAGLIVTQPSDDDVAVTAADKAKG